MTSQPEARSEQNAPAAMMPWFMGAGALAAYLITCNHGIGFNNLAAIARVSGNAWQPVVVEPLTWLVTLPFHWLPAKLVPLALNAFSALCAALTLALLARSVAILPHDRTEDQRERGQGKLMRAAWLPSLFAVLVCGLQVTFWEHATAFTGEMLNMLLFAYVIRCLLEFRLAQRESWLFRAAVAYGAGMANNWAMVGFLPLFIVALIWLKGLAFFNATFLSRIFLTSLVGLSAYLLLPIVNVLFEPGPAGFWLSLRYNLSFEKMYVLRLAWNKFAILHGINPVETEQPLWVLALPTFLPVLVMSVRWPSSFGDPSKLGKTLTRVIFQVAHAVLMCLCIWVALGPEGFCPRYILPMPQVPMLTFYYLGALGIGYFCGYFLIVFGGKRRSDRPRPEPAFMQSLRSGVVGAVWALAVLAPLLLLVRNLPQLQTTNGTLLQDYAAAMAASLPAKGAIVLSDDERRLHLVQSAFAKTGKARDYLLLDTASLHYPDYHKYLQRRSPHLWTANPLWTTNTQKWIKRIADLDLINLIVGLARSNNVYYLHPSFGYYFELLYPEPRGLTCRLAFRPSDSVATPPLSPDLIAENAAFWKTNPPLSIKEALLRSTPQGPVSLLDPCTSWFNRKLHLVTETNSTLLNLSVLYSLPLNFWGVTFQRTGYNSQPLSEELKSKWLDPAASYFELAHQLNPYNIIAQTNFVFTRSILTSNSASIRISRSILDPFDSVSQFQQALRNDGPFDEPSRCFVQGWVFSQGGNYRQAANEFARAKNLCPNELAPRVWLASLEARLGLPDEALKEVSDIYTKTNELGSNVLGFTHTGQPELLNIEAGAYLIKNDLRGAMEAVETAEARYPEERYRSLTNVIPVFWMRLHYSNTVTLADLVLKEVSTNAAALYYKGNSCVQLSRFDEAIVTLTQLLALVPNTNRLHHLALLCRAEAYAGLGKLPEAKGDYETLQKAFPTEAGIYFGLGDVAYREKDTNAAIRNYQLYLTNASPNLVEERKQVTARLNELKRGGP
jgi:tetratricopeptide (TPR) repeat protein